MSEVVELDNTSTMTPKQVIARAGREDLKAIAILGINKDGEYFYVFSDSTNVEMYWLLSRARQHIMDGDFNEDG